MSTHYHCQQCESLFPQREANVTLEREPGEAWGVKFTHTTEAHSCPTCGCDDLDNAFPCERCGERPIEITGTDLCTGCYQKGEDEQAAIAATVSKAFVDLAITNRNADHLRAHADMEHEDVSDEEIIIAQLDTLTTGPKSTVEELGQMCRAFSDDEHEVHFRVEFVRGKAVAYPVRESRNDQTVPPYLRRAS